MLVRVSLSFPGIRQLFDFVAHKCAVTSAARVEFETMLVAYLNTHTQHTRMRTRERERERERERKSIDCNDRSSLFAPSSQY